MTDIDALIAIAFFVWSVNYAVQSIKKLKKDLTKEWKKEREDQAKWVWGNEHDNG